MKTQELKIEIPKGFEIDKEKSTFEKIVFKEVKTDLQELLNYHNLTEEEFNKLSGFEKECKVVAFYNKGWKPNWKDSEEKKYIPYFFMENFRLYGVDCNCSGSQCLSRLYFKNEEDVKEAVEKYFEIFKQSRTEI